MLRKPSRERFCTKCGKAKWRHLGEVPFRCYYGTVDATPLFVMLAYAYYAALATAPYRAFWPNIERALHWIDNYGDCDGDGFVEYSRQSKDGLVQQGWKDSNDSVFHADGTLADRSHRAVRSARICRTPQNAALLTLRRSGRPGTGRPCSNRRPQPCASRFDAAFWCDEISTYAIGLGWRKEAVQVRTSNPGHCLYTGIANADHAYEVAHSLLSKDFFSGWGIRTVASGEPRYNPISYHNGSVWPHDNALIAAGLARYGFKDMAGEILSGLLAVSTFVDLTSPSGTVLRP